MIVPMLLLTLLSSPRVMLLEDDVYAHPESALAYGWVAAGLAADQVVDLVVPVPCESALKVATLLRNQALRRMMQGRYAFDNLDLSPAESHYAAAVQRLHRVAALTGDLGELTEALSMLAATQLLQHETNAAKPTLWRLASIASNYIPRHDLFNPSMHATWQTAKRQVLPQRQLSIKVAPADAAIYVDGVLAGCGQVTTSAARDLPHYILITRPGHIPQAAVMEPAQAATLALSLIPPPPTPPEYTALVTYAREATGFPDPAGPLLTDIQEVWVLRAGLGPLQRSRFNLASGRRSEDAAPAELFALQDAAAIGRRWLVEAASIAPLDSLPLSSVSKPAS